MSNVKIRPLFFPRFQIAIGVVIEAGILRLVHFVECGRRTVEFCAVAAAVKHHVVVRVRVRHRSRAQVYHAVLVVFNDLLSEIVFVAIAFIGIALHRGNVILGEYSSKIAQSPSQTLKTFVVVTLGGLIVIWPKADLSFLHRRNVRGLASQARSLVASACGSPIYIGDPSGLQTNI